MRLLNQETTKKANSMLAAPSRWAYLASLAVSKKTSLMSWHRKTMQPIFMKLQRLHAIWDLSSRHKLSKVMWPGRGVLDLVRVHNEADRGQMVSKVFPKVLSSNLPENQIGHSLHTMQNRY